ncbi:hypothetical protein CCACVL1_08412 [Corchorus capsularis]|uniref:Uncharacterized protein n=1 Tax=Corchorus capsularis TaxID=210143 RepID=A0A1R3J0P7_COCAP|nr:hypothetical protein CCACVL1_08412 [Corchorus capsularis]
MAVTYSDLGSTAGLKKVDEYVLACSYIFGYQASKDDITFFATFRAAPASSYVNVSRWYNHIDALLRIAGVTGEGCVVLLLRDLLLLRLLPLLQLRTQRLQC